MQNKNKHEKGQVFLIAVLILVIGLTVGLSVASRSVTNLKSSLEEENSQRAFAAAEAGVEKALKGFSTSSGVSFGEANTKIQKVSVDQISGGSFLVNGGSDILQNDGADIWLSDHTNFSSPWSSGTLTIGWGPAGDCNAAPQTAPAIEVIIMSGTSTSISTAASQRYTFDPCLARQNSNQFKDGLGSPVSIQGTTFPYSTQGMPVTNGFIARVVPLYANAVVGVSTATVPLAQVQGNIINSTGTSGGTTRKIKYIQGWPKIPNEIFQYVLFQPN